MAAVAAVPTVSSLVHIAGRGDVQFHSSLYAGTKGEGKAIEGFALTLHNAPVGLGIEYMCHAAGVGDMAWQANGGFQGTRGQSKNIEGIAVRLTGPAAAHFVLKYVTHIAGKGDSPVATSGQYCGSKGESRAIEGIHVWLEAIPLPTVSALVHLAGRGDVQFHNSLFAGTKGESKNLEGFALTLNPARHDLGIEYMCHAAGVGDMAWQANGGFQGARGQSRHLEGIAIRLTGPSAAAFNVNYITHIAGKGDSPVSQNGAYSGTKGESRAIEGIHVWLTYR
jgi:uncharacterized protein YjdB